MNITQVRLRIAIAVKCAFSVVAFSIIFSVSPFSDSMLALTKIAKAEQNLNFLERRKAELEVMKLELDVENLSKDQTMLDWLSGIIGLLVGAGCTAAASIWIARRKRLGALDQVVHEKRLELYPRLVEVTERLAIYFPPKKSIGPEDCRSMGAALRRWYFAGGGIILSPEARDAYFNLARALTRASLVEKLRVPEFPQDYDEISVKKVKQYKQQLKDDLGLNFDDVESWKFGGSGSDTSAHMFIDFLFLQGFSSTLRTKLSEDLRSRRRPA